MKKISRKDFLRTAGTFIAGAAVGGLVPARTAFARSPVVASLKVDEPGDGPCARVYFCRRIDPGHLLKLYGMVNEHIHGKVAIKLHTGERGGPNILQRPLVQAFQRAVPNSIIVETNTLYHGDRHTTESHLATLKANGWTFCPVDIMDSEGPVSLPVPGGKHLKAVSMGGHIVNYDSMIVLTHFKGHTMGGFGGSMKNIAIGCADGKTGKAQVHGLGVGGRGEWLAGDIFMELMADSAKATVDYFSGHMAFINVMNRMSRDCDCAGTRAAEPAVPDIGIVASTDILAVDQASIDLVYEFSGGKRNDLIERIESRQGLHQLEAMRDLGLGSPAYRLIEID